MPVLNPLLLRWIVVAVVAVALFGAGAIWNGDRIYAKWNKEKGELAAAAVKIVTKQGEITERVVTEYQEKRVKGDTITKTIDKEVKVYVESKPLALSCMLDMRWVRLHDAAAAGSVPPAPSPTDAAPGAFSAATALPTVTANYAACGRNFDRLEALQGWVREQAK